MAAPCLPAGRAPRSLRPSGWASLLLSHGSFLPLLEGGAHPLGPSSAATSTTCGATWWSPATTARASCLAARCGPLRCVAAAPALLRSSRLLPGPVSTGQRRSRAPRERSFRRCAPASLRSSRTCHEAGAHAPTHPALPAQEGEGALSQAWKQQVPVYPELERLVDELLRWGEAWGEAGLGACLASMSRLAAFESCLHHDCMRVPWLMRCLPPRSRREA